MGSDQGLELSNEKRADPHQTTFRERKTCSNVFSHAKYPSYSLILLGEESALVFPLIIVPSDIAPLPSEARSY
jgi:hypothetical protein